MHSGIGKEATQTEVIKSKDMQRPHDEMTRNGMSEGGMEARPDMITEKVEPPIKRWNKNRKTKT